MPCGISDNEQRLLTDKQAIEALTDISNGLDAFVAGRKDELRILDETMHTIIAKLNNTIDVLGSFSKSNDSLIRLLNEKFDILIARLES
jgi:hypothetical protein